MASQALMRLAGAMSTLCQQNLWRGMAARAAAHAAAIPCDTDATRNARDVRFMFLHRDDDVFFESGDQEIECPSTS
jgi:hypothetical protein